MAVVTNDSGLFVGAACSAPGVVGLLQQLGAQFVSVGVQLPADYAKAAVEVLRLVRYKHGVSALLGVRGGSATSYLAAWNAAPGSAAWSLSAPYTIPHCAHLYCGDVGRRLRGAQQSRLGRAGRSRNCRTREQLDATRRSTCEHCNDRGFRRPDRCACRRLRHVHRQPADERTVGQSADRAGWHPLRIHGLMRRSQPTGTATGRGVERSVPSSSHRVTVYRIDGRNVTSPQTHKIAPAIC